MGDARRKRLLQERKRHEEQEARRWRGWHPREVELVDPGKPGVVLGRYLLHPDGTVYTNGRPVRRVRDQVIIDAVRAQFRERVAATIPGLHA